MVYFELQLVDIRNPRQLLGPTECAMRTVDRNSSAVLTGSPAEPLGQFVVLHGSWHWGERACHSTFRRLKNSPNQRKWSRRLRDPSTNELKSHIPA